MRVTLDALVVLDAIDRAGSFAAGAEKLYRVPSAVSYTMHKLEQDLGFQLFDRSGHRAKLTNAGVQLLRDGRELLRLADEAERKAKQVHDGWEARLSIAVGDVVPRSAVYPLMSAFYELPEHESTLLHVTTETQSHCWETLLRGRSDLVIGAPEPGPRVDGYKSQPLGEVELALVMPPTHPLANATEPLEAASCKRFRVVQQDVSEFESPADTSDELVAVDDCPSQVDAIRHGLGIGYVPSHLVEGDVATGRLVRKLVSGGPRLRIAAAWRPDSCGRALRWFLERLSDEDFQSRLIRSTHCA